MKLLHRFACLCAVVFEIAMVGNVHAQAWPSKPLRLVVPWPAGGLVDVAARHFATRLSTAVGQPVVVENKAGAGGTLGADIVAKAGIDGHTLLFSTSALSINAALQPKLPFDFAKDFEPLAVIAYAPPVLVVGPSFSPDSLKALVDHARANPGKLSYASAGIGSPAHMAGELFKSAHAIDVLHVPFAGAPAAMNEQIAGRIDYQITNAAVAVPQIKAGKVKALAVTSSARLASLPGVPTMAEAGVPNFEVDQWLGVFAPRGVAKAVSDRIVAEANKMLASDDFKQALSTGNVTPASAGSAEKFEAFVKQDVARWSALVKAQNIKAE